MKKLDLTGQRFGCLTVLRDAGIPRRPKWICRCLCGNETVVAVDKLRAGLTVSCGCHRLASIVNKNTTHGFAPKRGKSPEYMIWATMKARCYNPKTKRFERWGGRGIRVCDEWLNDFSAFLAHIGPRPSPMFSIDRIDNDGDYAPGNVRWATQKQQANNRSLSQRRTT